MGISEINSINIAIVSEFMASIKTYHQKSCQTFMVKNIMVYY